MWNDFETAAYVVSENDYELSSGYSKSIRPFKINTVFPFTGDVYEKKK